MSEAYIPATETVRATYCQHNAPTHPGGTQRLRDIEALGFEFDVWLAKHDEEVSKKARADERIAASRRAATVMYGDSGSSQLSDRDFQILFAVESLK